MYVRTHMDVSLYECAYIDWRLYVHGRAAVPTGTQHTQTHTDTHRHTQTHTHTHTCTNKNNNAACFHRVHGQRQLRVRRDVHIDKTDKLKDTFGEQHKMKDPPDKLTAS